MKRAKPLGGMHWFVPEIRHDNPRIYVFVFGFEIVFQ